MSTTYGDCVEKPLGTNLFLINHGALVGVSTTSPMQKLATCAAASALWKSPNSAVASLRPMAFRSSTIDLSVGLPKWTLEEWAVDFIALDFETANADLSSICQVGAVVFENGQPKHSFSSLVDPQDYFDPINTSIHGISEDSVRGAPTLAVVHAEMHKLMSDKVVVCHSAFDRAALRQAEQRHALESIACEWLDTTMVVRRAWPKYASKGYGLENLARDFGIEFQHHNAVEDARATGVILLRAIAETRMTLGDWILRVKKPINLETAGPIKRAGNAEGPFFGEVAVFTGALSMPRHEAADMAAAVGCQVDDSVTKSTTLLIVGDQDAARLAEGQSKSSKQLKAERLIAKGQYIRILRETDFRAMSVEP